MTTTGTMRLLVIVGMLAQVALCQEDNSTAVEAAPAADNSTAAEAAPAPAPAAEEAAPAPAPEGEAAPAPAPAADDGGAGAAADCDAAAYSEAITACSEPVLKCTEDAGTDVAKLCACGDDSFKCTETAATEAGCMELMKESIDAAKKAYEDAAEAQGCNAPAPAAEAGADGAAIVTPTVAGLLLPAAAMLFAA